MPNYMNCYIQNSHLAKYIQYSNSATKFSISVFLIIEPVWTSQQRVKIFLNCLNNFAEPNFLEVFPGVIDIAEVSSLVSKTPGSLESKLCAKTPSL